MTDEATDIALARLNEASRGRILLDLLRRDAHNRVVTLASIAHDAGASFSEIARRITVVDPTTGDVTTVSRQAVSQLLRRHEKSSA